MNTYILQKDLPDAKAGTKYIQKDPQLTDFYFSGAGSNYRPEVVENNPEWFRKEPEPESISVVSRIDNTETVYINPHWLSLVLIKYSTYSNQKVGLRGLRYDDTRLWVLSNVPEAK